jgi:hypothetical protein
MPVSNTLDAVKPNPLPSGNYGHRSICDSWTGGCVNQAGGELMLAANGGHTEYGGNEVYACAMRTESPAWARLTNPSSTSGGNASRNSAGNYGDGTPRAVHGWHRCTFGNGRLWYAGLDGMYTPSGEWTTACYSFNRSTLRWTYHGLGLATLGGDIDWQAGVGSYDPIGNRVWSSSGAGANSNGVSVYSVDAGSGAITTHNIIHGRQPRCGAIAHDLRVWILVNPYQNDIAILNLADPNAGFEHTRPTGSPDAFSDGAGCVYHRASRALLFWDGYGANIRKLSIPPNPLTGAYTWSQVAPASNNPVVPSGPANEGTYGKFSIVEDMGNGQSALVLVNSTTGPVYVYKLPAAGV